MYIIEASDEYDTWISGIFEQEHMAKTYIDSIPTNLKEKQKLIYVKLSYPFHIIERDRTFKYSNKKEMIQELNEIELDKDIEKVYFNIYTINSDYQPKKPGTDYMGILNHDHVDKDFINWYRNDGEEFLKRRRILSGYIEEDSNFC
jgi:hypothetical protein